MTRPTGIVLPIAILGAILLSTPVLGESPGTIRSIPGSDDEPIESGGPRDPAGRFLAETPDPRRAPGALPPGTFSSWSDLTVELPPPFLRRWGTGIGSFFQEAYGIAVDGCGNVFTAEYTAHRVQRFTETGTFLGSWNAGHVTGIATDRRGHVYVVDQVDKRIRKYTTEGVFVREWGSNVFSINPFAIAVGPDGHVYVTDWGRNCVFQFTADGDFVRVWGRSGRADGLFSIANGIAVGPDGSVYVVDRGKQIVQKFSADGVFLRKWGTPGSGPGQFMNPLGIATDRLGNVYVTDTWWTSGISIQKFTSDGAFLMRWSSAGTDPGQLRDPWALALDPDLNVYVMDRLLGVNEFGHPSAPVNRCAIECASATASLPAVWPPNGSLAPVTITGIDNHEGGPIAITVTGVTQDEPLLGEGSGHGCPDAVIQNGQARVRIERSGSGNGRVYEISFVASNQTGNSCAGTVRVCVPHDASSSASCVDDGQDFSSLAGCSARVLADESTALPPLGLAVPRSAGREVTVAFSLAEDSRVLLTAYDVAGRRVATLVSATMAAGTHRASWNAAGLPRGIYFLRLGTEAGVRTRPVLIR